MFSILHHRPLHRNTECSLPQQGSSEGPALPFPPSDNHDLPGCQKAAGSGFRLYLPCLSVAWGAGRHSARSMPRQCAGSAGGPGLPLAGVAGNAQDCQQATGSSFRLYLPPLRSGLTRLEAEVRKGACNDAIWYAIGANKAHGLRRTHADKEKAIRMALQLHPEYSTRRIAEHVGCSMQWVVQVTSACHLPRPEKTIGKDGKAYPATMPRKATVAAAASASPAGQRASSETAVSTDQARNVQNQAAGDDVVEAMPPENSAGWKIDQCKSLSGGRVAAWIQDQ